MSEAALEARRPPGPRGVRGFLAFTTFARDPLAFVERFARSYPGAGTLPMLGMRLIYLSEPELIGQVLLDDEHFTKDWTTRSLDVVLGRGLLTSEGAPWRRRRKLIAPSLRRAHIAHYAELMVARTRRFVDEVPVDRAVDVKPYMMRLTLEIVAEALFGARLGDAAERIGEALEQAISSFEKIIYTWRRFAPAGMPLPVRARLRRASEALTDVVDELVAEGRRRPPGPDLLSRLLEARDEDGEALDDRELRDEIVTMLLAGHETTAMALCFAFWALSREPAARARLVAELDDVLGGRPATADDLARLPYLGAVVRETLRVYPPIWMFGREAIADVDVGRYHLVAGDQVLISPWILHRDERWFPDPGAFRPDRWEGGLEERLPKHAYFPFGGGHRVCVGMHFAMMEAALVLATVFQGLELDPEPGFEIALNPALTLRPRRGLRMRIRRR